VTLGPIVHVLSLRCDPAAAFDAYARIGEWWHLTHLAQPPETPSEIRVTFETAASGCSVRFEHGGWTAANVEQRAKFREWPLLLRRFAALADS